MSFDVFIPTAGLGTRLGKLSKHLNKSLLPINHKPIISHIIEKFPSAKVYHIAIGFRGKLVKDYLLAVYPKKKFNFIKIKNFSGKGSGLGLTLINSVKNFKRPFYFISCDSFLKTEINFRNYNWLAYSKKKDFLNNYRHLRIKNSLVSKIVDKKENRDKNDKIYIGLAFIKNFKKFKKTFLKEKKNILKVGEVGALSSMIENSIKFKAVEVDWHDTGNVDSYLELKKKMDIKKINILHKENEAIWFVNKKVIKFSLDKKFIKNRVIRSKKLTGYVPKILNKRDNFYTYNFVSGKIFSEIQNLDDFKKLLKISKKFWRIKNLKSLSNKKFIKGCNFFYKNKTIKRLDQFYRLTGIKDNNYIINEKKINKLSELLKKIDWNFITKGIPSRFHGDYHFENIIYNKKSEKFTFLDWRQDFNDDLDFGDLYYDLAKLMHGLIISHEIVNNNHFYIKIKNNSIKFNIKRFSYLKIFEAYFRKWIVKNGFSLKKVYILTSLIYLNIAALHHDPYNKFLYFFGVYMLNKSLLNYDNSK